MFKFQILKKSKLSKTHFEQKFKFSKFKFSKIQILKNSNSQKLNSQKFRCWKFKFPKYVSNKLKVSFRKLMFSDTSAVGNFVRKSVRAYKYVRLDEEQQSHITIHVAK